MKMKFKIGDEISFNGSIDHKKEVYYSGLRTEGEKDPSFPNDNHITRVLVTNPRSRFRVTGFDRPYYVCEKLWELGDEEMPILGRGIYIHEDEAVPYEKKWNGTVINKCK